MLFDERKRKYNKCAYVIRKRILNQSILKSKEFRLEIMRTLCADNDMRD